MSNSLALAPTPTFPRLTPAVYGDLWILVRRAPDSEADPNAANVWVHDKKAGGSEVLGKIEAWSIMPNAEQIRKRKLRYRTEAETTRQN